MEPTIGTDVVAAPRSRPRALIAAGVLTAMIVLGGAASVFAASPSAKPSASAGTGTGSTNHVCDRSSDTTTHSSSSSS